MSVALGLVLGLMALEVALQVGALVVWSRRQNDDGSGCVLCVGDSFTYGLGASVEGGSYPRQLEALLRQAGTDAKVVNADVVNGGWPGQSSREVLLRLPEQIARHDPKLVCILVGVNDPVKRPEYVRNEELSAVPDEGFAWRLRLPQVFAMMANWLRRDQGPPAFVGTWHVADFEVTFEPNGRVVMGKDELRWLADETGVTLILPNGGAEPMRWEITAAGLSVSTPSFAHTLLPGPSPAPAALTRAEKALAQQDWAAAKPLLLQALSAPGHAAAAREGLVKVAIAEGDAVARDRLVAELEAAFSASSDVPTGEALAQVLAARGSIEAAVHVAERVLRSAPESVRTWGLLLTHATSDRVLACMQAVLTAAPGNEAWRPALLQMRAGLRRKTAPVEALHDLCRAFLQNDDRGFLQRQVELAAADFPPAVRQEALARLPTAERERVAAALAGDAGAAGVQATLRSHLERMVALCRTRGIEVWLLSYPEPDAVRDALVSGVAAAHGARFVPLHPRFAELLQTTPRAELFIADGHCTDRGYGVMAAAIAAAMRR